MRTIEAVVLTTFGPDAVEWLFGRLYPVTITYHWPDGISLRSRLAVRSRKPELLAATALKRDIPTVHKGWAEARVEVGNA